MTLTPEALADLRVLSFDDAPVTAFSVTSTISLLDAGYAHERWRPRFTGRGLRSYLKITAAGRAALKREHDREQSK